MTNLLLLLAFCLGNVFSFSPCMTLRRPLVKTRLSALPDYIDLSDAVSSASNSVPAVTASSSQSLDLMPIGVAGIVALVGISAVAVLAGMKRGDATRTTEDASEPEPEPIDISIPYDAAARLAFRELQGVDESAAIDEAQFAKFKPIYEEAAVVEATIKKRARDMAELQAALEKKAAEMKQLAGLSS